MTRSALLLLPGTLADERLWEGQLAALSEHAEVQIPDLTQHNDIGKAADTILQTAPETFALAGFSMGGIIAQEIVKRAPGRVERLALLDTSTGVPASAKRERFQSWKEASRDTFDALLNTFVSWVHPENSNVIPSIGVPARELGVEVLRQQAGILQSQHNEAETLHHLYGPALILHGADDPVSTSEDNRLMARHCQRARLICLGTCGHYSPLEQPEAVSAALQYWLQE